MESVFTGSPQKQRGSLWQLGFHPQTQNTLKDQLSSQLTFLLDVSSRLWFSTGVTRPSPFLHLLALVI